MADNKPHYQFT